MQNVRHDYENYQILEVSFAVKWRCGVSNPGPLACKASALPLSYTPNRGFSAICEGVKQVAGPSMDMYHSERAIEGYATKGTG